MVPRGMGRGTERIEYRRSGPERRSIGKMKERVAMRDIRTGLRVLWRVSRRFLHSTHCEDVSEVDRLNARTVLETALLRRDVPSAGPVDEDLAHARVRLSELG